MAQRAIRVTVEHSPVEIAEAAAANSVAARIARLTEEPPPPTRSEPPAVDETPDSFMVGPPVTDSTNTRLQRERRQRRG